MESLKELWTKEFLPNIRKEICTEIDSLKVSLRDLSKRLDEIEKSQSFISKKYDTVTSTITNLKKHNEDVKGQVQKIEEDVNKLGNDGYGIEVKFDELEQYARRDCLEITGIPVVPNDNPALLVKEMSEIMGVNLDVNDILPSSRFLYGVKLSLTWTCALWLTTVDSGSRTTDGRSLVRLV